MRQRIELYADLDSAVDASNYYITLEIKNGNIKSNIKHAEILNREDLFITVCPLKQDEIIWRKFKTSNEAVSFLSVVKKYLSFNGKIEYEKVCSKLLSLNYDTVPSLHDYKYKEPKLAVTCDYGQGKASYSIVFKSLYYDSVDEKFYSKFNIDDSSLCIYYTDSPDKVRNMHHKYSVIASNSPYELPSIRFVSEDIPKDKIKRLCWFNNWYSLILTELNIRNMWEDYSTLLKYIKSADELSNIFSIQVLNEYIEKLGLLKEVVNG